MRKMFNIWPKFISHFFFKFRILCICLEIPNEFSPLVLTLFVKNRLAWRQEPKKNCTKEKSEIIFHWKKWTKFMKRKEPIIKSYNCVKKKMNWNGFSFFFLTKFNLSIETNGVNCVFLCRLIRDFFKLTTKTKKNKSNNSNWNRERKIKNFVYYLFSVLVLWEKIFFI